VSVSGSSGDLPSKARVGPAPEKSGDASRLGSGVQSGLALVAARGESLRQWGSGCRLICMGRAPIYWENPSTRSRHGDELDSISNSNQMRCDPNGIEKGVKLSLRCTLCRYELRPRANGCVGSGLTVPIPSMVAGPQGQLAGPSVLCVEGKEAGWAARPWLGCTQKRKRVGWAGSRVSWVSAHHRVGFRNSFSFSKSFYNL
jgi:hypothetical protein